MSCHFTYVEDIDKGQLLQGDLLCITEELRSVLEKYHPHYLKDDYRYFLVLTQSCDLVKRENRPYNANYITLAAVRPFDLVLRREAESIQPEEFEKKARICRSNKKSKLIDFIRKVLNNNENEFFYLHDDDQLGLSEPHCAFLRLSIALRTSEHYDKCLTAKFLQLKEEFRAKLGWLVGNLYSRIGTRDWTPETDFKKLVDDIIDHKFVWFSPEVVTALKKQIDQEQIDISTLDPETIQELALKIQIPSKKEKKDAVLESIKNIITNSNVLVTDANIEDLLYKIDKDPVFKSVVK